MKLSDERIKILQSLLNDELGLGYDAEQVREAGMAIMRFVLVKNEHQNLVINKGDENGAVAN